MAREPVAHRARRLGKLGTAYCQGKPVLYQHALEGIQRTAGLHAATGGIAHSDAEVKAGVDYMVAVSQ